ncbi:MAG: glycoside hydrolase family 88 protein [Anaerolineales bacterium]
MSWADRAPLMSVWLALALVLSLVVGCRRPAPVTAQATPTATAVAPTATRPVAPTLIRLTAAPPPSQSAATATPQPQALAERFTAAILARWPDANDIVGEGWEYNTGIVLYGLAVAQQRSGDPAVLAYIQRWVDGYVGPAGEFTLPQSHNLDLVQPANLLLYLYESTGEARYLTAARTIADDLLADHPRNAAGGFWHKDIYPEQMWLDGVYMAGPFLAQLGALTGEAAYGDAAAEQALLLAEHTQDPATGLLYHAWDASGQAAWAAPDTGRSPVVWLRAMGWYTMALVDMLQALPADHPSREALLAVLQSAAAGLADAQDRETGLWFQVVDQPDLPGNWVETSGSAMVIYALRKGVDADLLPARYGVVAARGWAGLQRQVTLGADGRPSITGAVEGMGVQPDAAAYVAKRRLTDSPHGLLGILLAATAMAGR